MNSGPEILSSVNALDDDIGAHTNSDVHLMRDIRRAVERDELIRSLGAENTTQCNIKGTTS